MEKIRVGMAEIGIAKSPKAIETQALGSCVGIVLYDPVTKIGGVAHSMLPDVNCAKKDSRGNLAKFVNTAVELLVSKMIEKGAKKKSMVAKLAGGANMFPDISSNENAVGARNVEAARSVLKQMVVPIVAEDVGGSMGRTVTLDTATGTLVVRSFKHGEVEI